MIYSFDVTVATHDLIKDGVTEARLPHHQHYHHRVVIAGDDPVGGSEEDFVRASLDAAQMAGETLAALGVVVTGVYLRI